MYINYEYTQTDKIDAVETFHETSLQFRKGTKFQHIISLDNAVAIGT